MPAPSVRDDRTPPRSALARATLLGLLCVAAAVGPVSAVRSDGGALHFYFHVETCLAIALLGAVGLVRGRDQLLRMVLVALLPALVGVGEAVGQVRAHALAVSAPGGLSPAADVGDFMGLAYDAGRVLAWGEGTGGLAILLVALCAALQVGQAPRSVPASSILARAAPTAVAVVVFVGLAVWRLAPGHAVALADAGFLLAVGLALAGFVVFADPTRRHAAADAADAGRRSRLALSSALAIALGVLLLDHATLGWFRGDLVGRVSAAALPPQDMIALQARVDHRRWAVLVEPLAVAAALALMVLARMPGGARGARRIGGRPLGVGIILVVAFGALLLGNEVLFERELVRLHSRLAVLDAVPGVAPPSAVTSTLPALVGPVVFVEARGALHLARGDGAGDLASATPDVLVSLLQAPGPVGAGVPGGSGAPGLTLVADGRAPFAPLGDLAIHAPLSGCELRIVTRPTAYLSWPVDSFARRLDFGVAEFIVALETADETSRRLDRDRDKRPTREVVLLDEDGASVGLLGWKGAVPIPNDTDSDRQGIGPRIHTALDGFSSHGADVAPAPGVPWSRILPVLFAVALEPSYTRLEGVTVVTDRARLERELAGGHAAAGAAPSPPGRVTFFRDDPAARDGGRSTDAPPERLLPQSAGGPMPAPLIAIPSSRDFHNKGVPTLFWTAELEASLRAAFSSCYAQAQGLAPDLQGEMDTIVDVVGPAAIAKILVHQARHFTQSLPAAHALTQCLEMTPFPAQARPVDDWNSFWVTVRFGGQISEH